MAKLLCILTSIGQPTYIHSLVGDVNCLYIYVDLFLITLHASFMECVITI